MAPIYCSKCGDLRGMRPVPPTDVLGSTDQQDKHAKHTSASTQYPVQSVFDSTSTQYYDECMREAYEKGAIEQTPRGTNIVFCPSTGSDLGSLYRWGVQASRPDTLLVVNTTDATRARAMLAPSSQYAGLKCDGCGDAML